MTLAEMEAWETEHKRRGPFFLDRQAYAVLLVLGRKHAFSDWWCLCSDANKEEIFAEIRDAIRYANIL